LSLASAKPWPTTRVDAATSRWPPSAPEIGLVIADPFRDGNVPAGMGNLLVAQRAFAALPLTVTERFLRADSACYEEKLLKGPPLPAGVISSMNSLMERVTATFDEETLARIRHVAGARGVSRFLNLAARERLARLELLGLLDELDEKYGAPSPALRREISRDARRLFGRRRRSR
jgi:hypothetical protein